MEDSGHIPGDLTLEDWEIFLEEVDAFEPVLLGTLVADSPVVFFGNPYQGV